MKGDGDCLFSALLQGFAFDPLYTPQHMRFQILMAMMDNLEDTFATSAPQIMATYSGGEGLGPFSLQGWFEHMCKKGAFGDQAVLTGFSRAFPNVALSVVRGSDLSVIRVRHNRALANADVVVVRTGTEHYVAAGTDGFFPART